jgi:hypothetical protein
MDPVSIRRVVVPTLALVAMALAFVLLAPSAADARPFDARSFVAQTSQDARVFFGQDVVVEEDQVYESVVTFGGEVDVRGTVEGTVVAFGGDVTISGTVYEEVVVFGGNVVFEPTARIGTRLDPGEDGVIAFGGTVTEEPGSEITGGVIRIGGGDLGSAVGWAVGQGAQAPFSTFFSYGGWLISTLIFLILGLVAAALLPNQMRALGRHLSARPAGSLGWGALTFFIIVPVALVALVFSIVGLLMVIPGIFVLLLFYFFAVVSVGAMIAGRFVAGRVSSRNELFLATAVGVVATSIVSVVPVLGGLLILAMMVFGTGAALLAIGEWRRRRRTATAPAVPPGAPLTPGGGQPPQPPAAGQPAYQQPYQATSAQPYDATAQQPYHATAQQPYDAMAQPYDAMAQPGDAMAQPGDAMAHQPYRQPIAEPQYHPTVEPPRPPAAGSGPTAPASGPTAPGMAAGVVSGDPGDTEAEADGPTIAQGPPAEDAPVDDGAEPRPDETSSAPGP